MYNRKIIIIILIYLLVVNIYLLNSNSKEINLIIDKTIRFNKWNDAKKELEKYLKNNPDDSYALSIYGVVLNELGLFDDAINYTKTAINYETSSEKKGDYYYNLAIYYYAKKLEDISLQMLEKSLSLNNLNAQAYYMAGLIYFNKSNFEKWVENWKMYISLTDNIEKKNKIQNVLDIYYAKLEEERKRIEEEKRRLEEQKRLEEEKRRLEEERRKREEEERLRLEEEKRRREEAERLRLEEERRKREEEERLRLEEEKRRREEYLKNLKEQLKGNIDTDAKSLQEYKIKEKNKEADFEEID